MVKTTILKEQFARLTGRETDAKSVRSYLKKKGLEELLKLNLRSNNSWQKIVEEVEIYLHNNNIKEIKTYKMEQLNIQLLKAKFTELSGLEAIEANAKVCIIDMQRKVKQLIDEMDCPEGAPQLLEELSDWYDEIKALLELDFKKEVTWQQVIEKIPKWNQVYPEFDARVQKANEENEEAWNRFIDHMNYHARKVCPTIELWEKRPSLFAQESRYINN